MGDQEKDCAQLSPENQLARSIVNELVGKGVKLLALDFDKTIVSVHTAGYWRQGTDKLVEHVRPCFKALIKESLESSLHVCVVTYSMQPTLIRDVLKMALPKCETSKVIIRGNSKEWLPAPSISEQQQLGKEQHLAWICTELFNKCHVIIAAHEILLMDDDEENCSIALQFGHQAFEVPEEITLADMQKYAKEVQVRKIVPEPS